MQRLKSSIWPRSGELLVDSVAKCVGRLEEGTVPSCRMAVTSAVIPSVGAQQPTPSSSVKPEIDAIGLAPLVPAPVLPPLATSPVSQVQMSTADLFVQYHEYFQKLQLDMQVAQPPGNPLA